MITQDVEQGPDLRHSSGVSLACSSNQLSLMSMPGLMAPMTMFRPWFSCTRYLVSIHTAALVLL